MHAFFPAPPIGKLPRSPGQLIRNLPRRPSQHSASGQVCSLSAVLGHGVISSVRAFPSKRCVHRTGLPCKDGVSTAMCDACRIDRNENPHLSRCYRPSMLLLIGGGICATRNYINELGSDTCIQACFLCSTRVARPPIHVIKEILVANETAALLSFDFVGQVTTAVGRTLRHHTGYRCFRLCVEQPLATAIPRGISACWFAAVARSHHDSQSVVHDQL